MDAAQTLTEKCTDCLSARWDRISMLCAQGDPGDVLSDEYLSLKDLVRACLTSSIKSYHYVLPTQILCKAVDPSLDAHSLQAAWGVPGAFDARTVAHKVIVPFDQANNRVLGGSPEPYVNNPLRYPAVLPEYREQQKNKADWDKLVRILDIMEQTDDASFTRRLFDQVLLEIHRLLADVVVVYPTPNRVSLSATSLLVDKFLSDRSGGERAEAVATALFRTIGDEFSIFDDVKRGKVNAADAATGMLADIECWFDAKIVLLAEVKDRTLTLTQLDAKLDAARAKRISEILFLAERGKALPDAEDIDQRIEAEFSSGQNIYVSPFPEFSLGILILLGEEGRVEFLANVGKELDRANAPIAHRRAWAELLRRV